jgi:hypothetical protein
MDHRNMSNGTAGSAVELVEQPRASVLERKKAATWTWYKSLILMDHNRWLHKVNGEQNKPHFEHEWLFQVVDIVYVGAMTNVSWLIKNCGNHPVVFMTCGSYMVIMYTTRNAFDTYSTISDASGIVHLVLFCFYSLTVFVMMLNIDADSSGDFDDDHPAKLMSFGECQRSHHYNYPFALAFVLSRAVLIIMYIIYLSVYHESNFVGASPTSGKSLMLSDITTEEELKDVIKERAKRYSHRAKHHSLDSSSSETIQKHYLAAAAESNKNELYMHYTLIICTKILPMALSSGAMMLITIPHINPELVFLITASLEVLGDLLAPIFAPTREQWKCLCCNFTLAKERLGLFFMLVVGEALFGLNEAHTVSETAYETLM